MPVRFLSDAQREQLSGFPAELEPESLDRFFTLNGANDGRLGPKAPACRAKRRGSGAS